MPSTESKLVSRLQRKPSGEHSVRLAMSTPVRFIAPTTTVADAIDLARKWGIHHLPVGDNEAPQGLVCTCDLRDAPADMIVGDWAKPALTIPADAGCKDAASKMRDQVIGSLLVTDGENICGIVTRADLARQGGRGASLLREAYCVCCGATSHLHEDQYEQLLCVDCRERALEPEAFDTGGGD